MDPKLVLCYKKDPNQRDGAVNCTVKGPDDVVFFVVSRSNNPQAPGTEITNKRSGSYAFLDPGGHRFHLEGKWYDLYKGEDNETYNPDILSLSFHTEQLLMTLG